MSFNFKNLTSEIRSLMVEEVNLDIDNNNLYISERLSAYGKNQYVNLLLDSIKSGSEETLLVSLNGCFRSHYERRNAHGGYSLVNMPVNAAQTLAEGEFNRFYIRALCRVALSSGKSLKIYRAKMSSNPRAESELKIGKLLDAQKLLSDLRKNPGVDTALGMPPGPNSGLSVELI